MARGETGGTGPSGPDYEATVNELVEQISRRSARLNWLKTEHDRLGRELAGRDAAHRALAAEVAEKENVARSLMAQVLEKEEDLEAARAGLAEREGEALGLQQRLESARSQYEAERRDLSERLETTQAQGEAAVASIREHLRTALSLLAQREAAVAELRQGLDSARDLLAQREATVAELRRDLESARDLLAQREATVAELRQGLESASDLLAQREVTVAGLRQDRDNASRLLAESQTETARLRHEIDETTTQLRQDLNASRRSLTEREASLGRLQAELATHQAAITGIVGSWSWRVTKPARCLKAALRRLRKVGFLRFVYWTLQLPTRLRSRRNVAIIEGSWLFDTSWYLSQYPDVARDGISPILHYLQSGAREGRRPNPLFDTAWYLERYPDVAQTGQNPLLHYFLVGAAEGRDPSPGFDTSAYLERYPDVAADGINPLAHFLQRGIAEGRQPDSATRSNHPDERHAASDLPGSYRTGSSDNATLIEDDYLDVSRLIADQRRHQLADLTFTPADMINLGGRDLRAHASGLSFELESVPEVSIVIRADNSLTRTLECLTSIYFRTEDLRYEVIVINDASSDDARDVLSLISNLVHLEHEKNLGFLFWRNVAAERARGQYLVFLSNDIQVSSGWLRSLLETFSKHDNVGAVGSKILSPDGRLQEAGALVNPDGSTRFVGRGDDPAQPRYNYPREVDYCSGVCLMLRKDTLLQVSRFDEGPAPAYYEDVDLCLHLRARGRRVIYNPAAVIVRHLSATPSSGDPSHDLPCVTLSRQRIQEIWLERIEALNQVRVIAFYLPQFHPIPENDRWWGKGFTEWTKVAKAKPNFVGHYQPHFPSDLGFYDLRVEQVMEEQAALAQRYGIHGFCYYYYWFNGKRLLELPLERMLMTGKPDIPFCLLWANENWTRRWDGLEHEVLIGQDHSDEDDEAVIRDVIRYFRHPNYIRINGRPLFIVYRVDRFPNIRRTTGIWRAVCRTEGIGEIYLVSAETFQQSRDPESPSNHGCDAVVEFPPHGSPRRDPIPGELLNPNFAGMVSDYRDMLLRRMRRGMPGYVRFGTVMPSWDNTPRQQDTPILFHAASPGAFQAWLEAVIEDTREQYCGEERIVFVNAWNEWAEGAHLEPDQRFGHGYLEAVQNALEQVVFRSVADA